MATIADSLLLTLGLDGSDLEKGLSGVEQSIIEWVKSIATNVLDPLVGSSAFGALLSNVMDAAGALGTAWEGVEGGAATLQSIFGPDDGTTDFSQSGSDVADGLPSQYGNIASKRQDAGITEKLGAAATAPQESLTSLVALVAGEASPAFTSFGQTLAGLATALDGFFARLKDGASALSGLWNVFGTGKETSEALSDAWAAMEKTGEALWSGQKDAAATFFSSFEGALQPFKSLWSGLGEYMQGTFSGAFNQVVDAASAAGPKILDTLTGVFKTLSTVVGSTFSSISGMFTGIFDSIPDSVTASIKTVISAMSDSLSPEGINKETAVVGNAEAQTPQPQETSAANNAPISESGFWAGIKESFSSLVESLKAFDNQVRSFVGGFAAQSLGVGASQGLSPALAGATHNNTETTVNVGGIVVNAYSNDAVGIARETGEEVRRQVAAANKGVRQ